MKIILLVVGKTTDTWVQTAISLYEARIKHYLPFELVVIPTIKTAKNLTEDQVKEKEGQAILGWIKPGDAMVLLDEKGMTLTSEGFADRLQKKMNAGVRNLVFVVGGPYGFSPAVYDTVSERLSLSALTLTHQMVRILFIEQVYRAMTILKGEPYHHA
ncbi:MAG TPA: 23S rRNA (pseudouridine(1915)-N(3))-methyltransferase RlmH [Bacteroidales bacterium]|jgi:23S rRNA (pseudouridine1915-N3)-methyltransferase|nr:23S rRNA (pseudouridine(1915)-N(3))-methyltransferase RlmH [Bacteroidales bacterium]